jgi:hypothetical protein
MDCITNISAMPTCSNCSECNARKKLNNEEEVHINPVKSILKYKNVMNKNCVKVIGDNITEENIHNLQKDDTIIHFLEGDINEFDEDDVTQGVITKIDGNVIIIGNKRISIFIGKTYKVIESCTGDTNSIQICGKCNQQSGGSKTKNKKRNTKNKKRNTKKSIRRVSSRKNKQKK